MRRNLKNAVCRSIDDQRALFDSFLPQTLDDLRAGRDAVAEQRIAHPCGKFLHKILREPVGEGRKRLVQYHAAHFPMAGRGILAAGALGHFAIARAGVQRILLLAH